VLTFYSRKYWNFRATGETWYRKRNYIRCNFIPASRVRLALKDGRVHRGGAVKPTGTAINNFERECRSFNGINVAPRTAVLLLATCQHWATCAASIVQHEEAQCIIYVMSLNDASSIFHISLWNMKKWNNIIMAKLRQISFRILSIFVDSNFVKIL